MLFLKALSKVGGDKRVSLKRLSRRTKIFKHILALMKNVTSRLVQLSGSPKWST